MRKLSQWWQNTVWYPALVAVLIALAAASFIGGLCLWADSMDRRHTEPQAYSYSYNYSLNGYSYSYSYSYNPAEVQR